MSIREEMRDGLIEAYKPKAIDGASCMICGQAGGRLSLHLIEAVIPEAQRLPSGSVPMIQSRGTIRCSFAVCEACAPACSMCGIAVRTKRVLRAYRVLEESAWAGSKVYLGNGFCQHWNLITRYRLNGLPSSFVSPFELSKPRLPAVTFTADADHPVPKRSSPFSANVSGVQSTQMGDPTVENYRQNLLASKPVRTNFDSDDEFEECLGFWMSRQGRILAHMATAKRRAIGVELFVGDIAALSGTVYIAWFIANPNGPTAFAMGAVETTTGNRLFYRYMHFLKQETWLLGDLQSLISDCGNDFGALLERGVGSLDEHLASVSKAGVSVLSAIPSFVIPNENPSIWSSFQKMIGLRLANEDWGKELFFRQTYGTDFFGRAGEEVREAYEALKSDPTTDPNFLNFMWARYSEIPSFINWRPSKHKSQLASPAVVALWWQHAVARTTVNEGLAQFKLMWDGASGLVHPSGTEVPALSFAEVEQFFANFQLPLDS
ncbi:hypothetical protein [Sphingomonas sp. RB1R13]|uniref:hypothetical protein n=1 Tax=Sphingomonas sp. RB1R13 TaxID=3096159 RepID=UPI002FC5F9A1